MSRVRGCARCAVEGAARWLPLLFGVVFATALAQAQTSGVPPLMSGDCSASNVGVMTCSRINGAAVPASAAVVGTNASNQLVSTTPAQMAVAMNGASPTGNGVAYFDGTKYTNGSGLVWTGSLLGVGVPSPTESITASGAIQARGADTTAVANASVLDFFSGFARQFAFGANAVTYGGLAGLQVTSTGSVWVAYMADPATHSVGFGCGSGLPSLASCAASVTAAGAWKGASFAAAAGGFSAPLYTPPSSSASCAVGSVAWDASFFYVCKAANTWARAALSTF